MSYAIIGFGHIGQALARAFARNGIEVSVANTRDPESFASAAAAIGPTIIPKKLAEAVKADLRHYRSKWQIDDRPGVCRHASTSAGLRDRRKLQALTHPPWLP